MAIFKCKMCGANLNPVEGSTICECEYCGSKQTVSSCNDDKVLNTIARANLLRSKCEFDKAYNMFNQLIADGLADAETYWNIVLCKYGITYVDDYDGGKKPTINRMSNISILDDEDFQKVLELSDSITGEQYKLEANIIANIQKEILEIVNKEEPYDIFISYKESDEFGERTIDSVLAYDIYEALTNEGYKVFLSRVSLSKVIGKSYEPYIYSALYSAKVMLLVGTSEDYINAVWVKNEWSRFLGMIKNNKDKVIIPCYRDMDPYDLPKELRNIQSVNLAKIGAVQDIKEGIKKIIKKEDKEEKSNDHQIDLTMQFKRLGKTLNEEKWSNADIICDTILTLDPNSAEAYIGKVLVAFKCSTFQQLLKYNEPFEENENYILALKVANKDLKEKLIGISNSIKEKRAKSAIYRKAIDLKNNEDLIESLKLFETIKDYSLSNDYIIQIKDAMIDKSQRYLEHGEYDKARELCEYIKDYKSFVNNFDKEIIYCEAKNILHKSNIYSPEKTLKAMEKFKSLNDYKDSPQYYLKAQELYNKTIYENIQFQIRTNNYDGIEELLNKIIDYKDCRYILEHLSYIKDTNEYKEKINKAIDTNDEVTFNKYIKILEKDPKNNEYIKLSKERFNDLNSKKGKSWLANLFKK